jgi:ADP-ribose pyrophosphatase YjhB (NUDIX family)
VGLLLAGGVIVERNRVLLWRRRDRWEFPGKLVDRDETLEEAVTEGLGQRLGVEVWVGDIVCTTEFQQGEERMKAELLTAKIIDNERLESLSPDIDRVGFFALNVLEDLQREGKLSPSVEQLMRVIAREDLTLADFTP